MRMFRWKWKAAAAAGVHWHHVPPCIDLAVAHATYTCPIVPRRRLRRGVLEMRNANVMMGRGRRGIAHRSAGVKVVVVVVVIARLSVNGGGRSAGCQCRAAVVVLDWPWT
jgi:hypothetical protein